MKLLTITMLAVLLTGCVSHDNYWQGESQRVRAISLSRIASTHESVPTSQAYPSTPLNWKIKLCVRVYQYCSLIDTHKSAWKTTFCIKVYQFCNLVERKIEA